MTGTSENAESIARHLDEAFWQIMSASYHIRDAIMLIEKGEKEPDIKVPTIEAIHGTLRLALSATSTESSNWTGYAQARKSH